MSELAVTLLRLSYLALLWVFVFAAISVLRQDLFSATRVTQRGRGARADSTRARRTPAPPAAPSTPAPPRPMGDYGLLTKSTSRTATRALPPVTVGAVKTRDRNTACLVQSM